MRKALAAFPLVFLGIALGLAGWIGWDVWRAADEADRSVVADGTTTVPATTTTGATTSSTSGTTTSSTPSSSTTTTLPREWPSMTEAELPSSVWGCSTVGAHFEAHPCWQQASYSAMPLPPTHREDPVEGLLGWLGEDLGGLPLLGGILIGLEWVATPDGEALAGTFVVGQEAWNLRQVTDSQGSSWFEGDFGDLIVAHVLLTYPAQGFEVPSVVVDECGPPFGRCVNPGRVTQVPLGEVIRRLEIGWAYVIGVSQVDSSVWAHELGGAAELAEQSGPYVEMLRSALDGETVELPQDQYIFGAQLVFPGSSWYRLGLSPGLVVGTAPSCEDCGEVVEALRVAAPGLAVSEVQIGSPEAAALYLREAPSVVVVDEAHAQVGAPTVGARVLGDAAAIARLACYTLLDFCPEATRRTFEVVNTEDAAPLDAPVRRWCVNGECPVALGLIRNATYTVVVDNGGGFVLSGILTDKYIVPELGRWRDVHVGVFDVGTDRSGQPVLVHLVFSYLDEYQGQLVENWMRVTSFAAYADSQEYVDYLVQGDLWLPWDPNIHLNYVAESRRTLLPFEAEAALTLGHQYVMDLPVFGCDEDWPLCGNDEIQAFIRGQRADAPMGYVSGFIAWTGTLG